MFPVDYPDVDEADLTSACERLLSSLKSQPSPGQFFEVEIRSDTVRPLQVFEEGAGPECAVAALHLPDDPTHVVALFLHERWWSVEDVLQTSCLSRCGLVEVQLLMERVIVFLLSQVVERRPQQGALFSLHPRTEACKVLWSGGRAVAFYSFKHKGSVYGSVGAGSYLLPVLDTVLVRRSQRRRGLGLQMLEDFCSSFAAEPFVGISSPLSADMAAVCRKFLQQQQEQQQRLYEVEAPGDWTQRRNVWLKIRLGRYQSTSCEGPDHHVTPTQLEERRGEPSRPVSSTTDT